MRGTPCMGSLTGVGGSRVMFDIFSGQRTNCKQTADQSWRCELLQGTLTQGRYRFRQISLGTQQDTLGLTCCVSLIRPIRDCSILRIHGHPLFTTNTTWASMGENERERTAPTYGFAIQGDLLVKAQQHGDVAGRVVSKAVEALYEL